MAVPRVATIYYLIYPVSNKNYEMYKKQESMIYTSGNKKKTEAACERIQMSNLTDKPSKNPL